MAGMYNVGRENAAKMLGVSTRTIDRYVKSGKLSYKKIANKVLLSREEVQEMKQDFDVLHQEVSTEVVSTARENNTTQNAAKKTTIIKPSTDLDEKLDKIYNIFHEKDKIIEDKNQIIFVLQRRIGELETKLQTMVALPDYTKEKQEALLEKRKLEQKVAELTNNVKNEKVKSLVFVSIALVFILLAVFYVFKN